MSESPLEFDRINYYVENYGHPEIDEQRAVENFVICESSEMISPLVAQLHRISKGYCSEEVLDIVAGKRRKVKYGSYENWAKLMLIWVNEAKNRA